MISGYRIEIQVAKLATKKLYFREPLVLHGGGYTYFTELFGVAGKIDHSVVYKEGGG